MPASEFDEYARSYDEALSQGLALSGEQKEHFARERVRWLARQIGSVGAAPRVLDFGCGTGTAIPFLNSELGASAVVGVDVSEDSLGVARERYGSQARFTTFAALDQEAPFDLAYCNGVFHHVPIADRVGVMRSVFAALRPGGSFSLWENNPYNPGTRWVMSRIPFDRDAMLLTPRRTRALSQGAGFEIIGTDFLFIFPKFLSILRPIEPALSRLPLGAQYQVLVRRPPSG